MRIYSKACEHVLSALSCIAASEVEAVFSPVRLCREAGVNESYARKGFQSLSRSGYLKATTGPGGGYVFARNPGSIRLMEIVESIDGPGCCDGCVMGLPQCGDEAPCPLHESWMPMRKNLKTMLEATTLGDLIGL